MQKEAQRQEMIHKNFHAGPLDILFPYHMYFGGEIKLDKNDTETISTTLKFYNRQRAFMLWLHHDKFQHLLSENDKLHLKRCEEQYLQWNIGLKALSVLMLMQIRVGFNSKLRLVNRPAGRLWLYDFGLLYLGTYSYLLSHIAGMKLVYD